MENLIDYTFENRAKYIEALDSFIQKEGYLQIREIGGGKKHQYIPAPIKEALADYMFLHWHIVDENYIITNNQLICTIKMHYVPSYPEADEHFCTGSAAVPIQSAKNALEYQTPGVRAESISNALGTLGNIFGRSLGRKLNKNTAVSPDFKIRQHEQVKGE